MGRKASAARTYGETPARGGSDTIRRRGLVQLSFALTEEERRQIHAAAALAGAPANVCIRDEMTAWARRVLARKNSEKSS